MRISAVGIAALKEREGNVLKPYRDSGGFLSIGVGHCFTRAERTSGKVAGIGEWARGFTQDQVDRLLVRDLAIAEAAVDHVTVPLTPTQRDVLVSFAFNVGAGEVAHDGEKGSGFLGSTLLRLLNAGDYTAVPRELRRWIHSDGKVDPILVNRRQSELTQWGQA